jgi:hypothetical protein
MRRRYFRGGFGIPRPDERTLRGANPVRLSDRSQRLGEVTNTVTASPNEARFDRLPKAIKRLSRSN